MGTKTVTKRCMATAQFDTVYGIAWAECGCCGWQSENDHIWNVSKNDKMPCPDCKDYGDCNE